MALDLKGSVDVPGIGGVPKVALVGIGGVAAVYVGWKWWQSSQAADEVTPEDPGFGDAGVLPPVAGAVPDDNSFGLDDEQGPSGSDFGFTGTTNSQWTQYALAQLSQASDRWSYGDVSEALGAYLANRPLTQAQQQIVQAAIAVAGPAPEGSHVIVPGGNVPITVAPSGVRVVSTTSTTATIAWEPVAGAEYYRVYRSGASTNVGATDAGNHQIVVSGLKPNTEYGFQVAADTTGGTPGPKSAVAKGKTKAVSLKAPTGVRVSGITTTTATVSWSKVSGADSYRIYVNNVAHGAADAVHSSYKIQGLKRNTSYKVAVAADTTSQEMGPKSAAVPFKTKK